MHGQVEYFSLTSHRSKTNLNEFDKVYLRKFRKGQVIWIAAKTKWRILGNQIRGLCHLPYPSSLRQKPISPSSCQDSPRGPMTFRGLDPSAVSQWALRACPKPRTGYTSGAALVRSVSLALPTVPDTEATTYLLCPRTVIINTLSMRFWAKTSTRVWAKVGLCWSFVPWRSWMDGERRALRYGVLRPCYLPRFSAKHRLWRTCNSSHMLYIHISHGRLWQYTRPDTHTLFNKRYIQNVYKNYQ